MARRIIIIIIIIIQGNLQSENLLKICLLGCQFFHQEQKYIVFFCQCFGPNFFPAKHKGGSFALPHFQGKQSFRKGFRQGIRYVFAKVGDGLQTCI